MAQLGARLNGIQEVTGSIPVRSTNNPNQFPVNNLRLSPEADMFRVPTLNVLRCLT